MFNARDYDNAKPDGFAVLEIVDSLNREGAKRRFVPLKKSHLSGSIAGPLCEMRLCQTFGYTAEQCSKTLEAAYRFPLPGDAAVTGVRVYFGEVVIDAELKERQAAEAEYEEAKSRGKQAALTTRESPDVFTIRIAGLQPDQDILVETSYVQLSRREGSRWSLRVPLTTAPRYVRADERGTRHAEGQPLAIMRDPGHRFSLNLTLEKAAAAKCSTHAITSEEDGDDLKVRLAGDEVVPDRDMVLTWQCKQHSSNPMLHVLTHRDGANVYFLAMAAPPAAPHKAAVQREMVLLIDRSGSMEGSKWNAADNAAQGLLNSLGANDSFTVGLFHNTTRWLTAKPVSATEANLKSARSFLQRKDSGGTELGVALEQAITLPRGSETPAHYIVVITDAEVSDAGRILRLVHEEFKRPNPRRISMICIDSAPNAHLVNEIVEAGCGAAHHLTSDPNQEQLSSALAGLAEEFASPLAAGLALQVNRTGLEVFGRRVDTLDGGGSRVAMGDLPVSRTVWIAGRYAASAETDAVFRLKTAAGDELASCAAERGNPTHAALKPLFGAKRLNALEYLMTAGYTGAVLRDRMREIGFGDMAVDGKATRPSLYAENSMDAARKALRDLLVHESLEYGIACSETAFIAVRKEAGKQIEESIAVANALPAGWSDGSLHQMYALSVGGASPMMRSRSAKCSVQPDAQSAMREAMAQYSCRGDSGDSDQHGLLSGLFGGVRDIFTADLAGASPDYDQKMDGSESPSLFKRMLNRLHGKHSHAHADPSEWAVIYVGIPILENGEALLLDSSRACDEDNLPDGQTLFLALGATVIDRETHLGTVECGLIIKLYVGEGDTPSFEVTLADLLARNGVMPISICRRAKDRVRIVLEDPNGAWAHESPMIEIRLGY